MVACQVAVKKESPDSLVLRILMFTPLTEPLTARAASESASFWLFETRTHNPWRQWSASSRL